MRFLVAILGFCLALAGCGSDRSGAADNQAAAPSAEPAAGAQAPAQDLAPRVLAAMAALLPDPGSALYPNLREGSAGSVCGAVALRQPNGTHAAPVPFVVTPEGVALISATPHLAWDAVEDPFPPAYARWCATPEELEAMRAQIAAAPPPPPAEDPPPADVDMPEEPAPPPPPRAQPKASPPPPAQPPVTPWSGPSDPNDVSFTNAVRRPDQ